MLSITMSSHCAGAKLDVMYTSYIIHDTLSSFRVEGHAYSEC